MNIFKVFILIVVFSFLWGCKKEADDIVFLENKNDCSSREYFEENGEKLYLVCYDNAKIKDNESTLELSDYLKNNGIKVFFE